MQAIAISLGALKAPEKEPEEALEKPRGQPVQTAEELADFDDPDVQKFLQHLGAAMS